MNKPKFYLCGKMAGLSFEVSNGWREQITSLFRNKTDMPLHIENPCHYYHFNMDRSNITEREIMEFDLSLLRNCDIVIVNLDYPDSIGSAIEMYEASQRHIPVIGFGGLDVEVHPWIELCLTKRCKTMLDAVEYVIEFYLPNL